MFSANEAREKTQKILEKQDGNQIEEIFNEIEETINNGGYYAIFFNLKEENIVILESLGYRVEYETSSLDYYSYYSVSWYND